MKRNITIVQHYTADIGGYFDYVRFNNMQYAYKHGYNYIAVKVRKTQEYDSTWDKMFILERYIDTNNLDPSSWFHFLDADALYVNDNISLDSIIDKYNTPVIISENGPNGGELLNMGSILLQACQQTRVMLEYAVNFFHNNPEYKKGVWHEQTAINLFYKNHPQGSNTITPVPYNIINSHWRWNGDYSMFIYHCMCASCQEQDGKTRESIIHEIVSKKFNGGL
jgi:hypothetical protein